MRKLILLSLALSAFSAFPAFPASSARGAVVIPAGEGSGIAVEKFSKQKPDTAGILRSVSIALPKYVKGVYYAQDNAYPDFPICGNRVMPWYFACGDLPRIVDHFAYGVDNLKDLRFNQRADKLRPRTVSRYGCFMQLQLESGLYLSLLPVASKQAVAWLYAASNGELDVKICTYGTQSVSGTVPSVAWSVAGDPCTSSEQLFAMLAGSPLSGVVRLRDQKDYPEPFRYLGWCSYEEYKDQISQELLLDAFHRINTGQIPIRFALVDGGHPTLTHEAGNPKTLLASFAPNERFPGGYSALTACKQPDHLRWMGIWHNFNGHWGGFAANNDFGPVAPLLRPVERMHTNMVRFDSSAVNTFYEAFLGHSKTDGFDFLKVDWQAANPYLLQGTENAAAEAWMTSRAVDEIARRDYNGGMINCMAMNNITLLNSRYTPVMRVSEDYKLNNLLMAKEHLWQCYQNTLWMGQVMWPDHDMFHSSDKVSARIMAVSKALSGGPVYLSDAVDKIVAGNVWPLCYRDGLVLRPLAPAMPLPRSAISMPLLDSSVYYVAAPLPNRSVALVAYNLMVLERTLHASVSAQDYSAAGLSIQGGKGAWQVPAEGIYLYDFFAARGKKLDGAERFDLDGFSDKLLLMVPIEKGWAVIGRADKYLAPASVSQIAYGDKNLTMTLAEGGNFLIWSASGTPEADRVIFAPLGGGLWLGAMAGGTGPETINISR